MRRLFPIHKSKSLKRNIEDYRLLFAFKKIYENGVISMKGAVQHRENGEVVMLTTHSSPEGVNKPIPALESGWTVFGVDMIAPACYWNAFKAC